MSKIWDEREKALEDEYFRRKEQELIEKLRAKRAEQQGSVQASALDCPKCDGTLIEITFEEVLIDRCNKCHGLWLDAGELERLTRQESGWLSSFWKSLAG
ncbi:MAG TPA: zf-TFIIB domain-containing protein [Blastocatellia bacterium]|nr:zf-TFIIB domain-containing protein [Blastocatellia bacterium]